MYSNVLYDIAKRKLEYIRIGNKELVKCFADKEYSPSVIRACGNISKFKPKMVIKQDGKIEASIKPPYTDVA